VPTLTVYPDAGIGATTVDGAVLCTDGTGTFSWATIRAANGTSVDHDANAQDVVVGFGDWGTPNTWNFLLRGIFTFDTSALGAGALISSATFSIQGVSQSNNAGTIDINIYSAAPLANNALNAADYQTCGAVPFSTTIPYASWSVTGYNDFVLNADGIAAINKTGITKFSARDATHDVGGVEPSSPWGGFSSLLICDFADAVGTGTDPKLVIEYTVPAGNVRLLGQVCT
jgi:hypothetical protein